MMEVAAAQQEKFAMYGFEVKIPSDWRVEVNPKSTREKGDVAFHSKLGNRFFVTWGKLSNVEGRFKSLEEHRDKNVKQIRSGPDVKNVNISDSHEEQILGHRALFSHVTADVKAGMFSRNSYEREMWSIHLYCPERSRYYVVYSLLRDPKEYSDFATTFNSMGRSLVCH
jgi:hypothetical protein